MAQASDTLTSQKRGPGRPSRSDSHLSKKRKISTNLSTPITSTPNSPTTESQAEKQPPKLPSKISSHLPFPTLSEPQSAAPPTTDYQSIAASGVLAASLDRSRLKWINEGILERYWVKPESGKNARLAPPGNPDLKSQKHKGPCRIRVEPHIFEAEVYVEERAKVTPLVNKQYVQSAYGQPYRQGQYQQGYGGQQQQQQQQNYWQGRTLPPIQQQQQQQQHGMHHGHHAAPANTMPPISNTTHSPAPMQSSPPPPRTQQQSPAQQDKKASPDPVISMLATRASSDPELKALMKEVATGNASQEQLKVFQGHIDELTKVVAEEKKDKDNEKATEQSSTPQQPQQSGEMIQYDGTADSAVPPQQQQQQQQSYQHVQPHAQQHQPYAPAYHPQPQTWQPPQPPPAPAAPAPQPVILAFTTPGATEDRFLFPQNSILEALSPQHLLASFIVTRQSSSAAESTGLRTVTATATNVETEAEGEDTKKLDGETEVEFYQPITLMVEVAYNREHILECVKRWVKTPEEVLKHMEEVMGRCQRAPEVWLPLRLPVKGSKDAATEEEKSGGSGVSTPVKGVEDKKEGRKGVKYVKKALKKEAEKAAAEVERKEGHVGSFGKKDDAAATVTVPEDGMNGAQASTAKEATADQQENKAAETANGSTDAPPTTETGRPRRAVRKSVRISEG